MKKFVVLLFCCQLLTNMNCVVTLDFNSFVPKNPYEMRGNLANDYFGMSVSNAGDINKDGFDDIIIGAYGKNSGKGAAYVIYGGQNFADLNLATATLIPATTGFMISGNAANDWLGWSVSSAGDVDNDGYADIIVGAEKKGSFRGAAYVIYGGEKSSMTNIDLGTQTLNPLTTGFTITGNVISDYLGCLVNSAGDINNDGYDDIIVGAYGKNGNQGTVYVIYGGPRSSLSNIVLETTTLSPSTTGFKLTGSSASENFGWAASSAGDIDNDGYDDIIVGASTKSSWRGAAYVIYGGPKSSMSDLDFSTTTLNPSTTGFMITGNAMNDRLGYSVSRAGDVNNDGYADMLIGAYGKNGSQGAAYVIYGGPRSSMSNFVLPAALDPLTTGFVIAGNATNDKFAYSVNSAGDINQDGFDDIIIGASGQNGNKGAAYAIYGGPKSNMTNMNLSMTVLDPIKTGFSIFGTATNGQFGNAVSAIDINNDGFSDLLIAAYWESSSTGAAYALVYNECPDNCVTCSGLDVCDVCSGLYFLDEGQCLMSCPTTKFGLNGKCENCSNNCDICFSSTACQTCSGLYFLDQGQCLQNCPRTKFGSNGVCQNCPNNCDVCSSGTTCTTCSGSYFLSQGQCVSTCPATKFGSNGVCEECVSHCDICSDSTACEACSGLYFLYQGQCVKNCPLKTFASNNACHDCPLECSECMNESTCKRCIDGYTLSGSKCKKTETKVEEKGDQKAAAGAFEGVSIVGSSLSSGSSLPLNFGLVAKILRNVRYMRLTVSQELFETFVSWKVASGFLSAPGSWSGKYSSKGLPTVFSRYGLQSAFLINFWKPFVMTLIGIGLFAIFKAIEISMNNNKKSKMFTISKQVNVAASNFALTQFYSNLDDVLFYFTLEMRSTKFETGFRVCSSVMAISLFLVGVGFLVMHSKILGRYQKLKETSSAPQLEDFVSKFMNINLIFKDFKDTNSLTQSFLMINIGRSVLSSLIFATLFEYPMIQISFLIVLNLLMIVYLWNLKSFQEFTNTCGQMFCEVVLFIANICAFLLALFDHADSYPVASIERLGKCIIALNFILLFGCVLLLLVNIGKMLHKVYKDKKKPKEISLPTDNNAVILPKFNRPPQSLAQSNQSFSTNTSGINDSQKNLSSYQSQNTLQVPYLQTLNTSNLRLQQRISKNYSIHHPTRNKNPASFDAKIENLENIVLDSSQIEDFGETSQANLLTNPNHFTCSRLIRNREVTKARIAQFSRNNSGNETPKSRIQESSFNSSLVLNRESSMNQDVSLINFE